MLNGRETACKQVRQVGYQAKAGRANFQHQGLTEKGNQGNVKEGQRCWKFDLLAGYQIH